MQVRSQHNHPRCERYTLVSRDKRTADHFRHAWFSACSKNSITAAEKINRRSYPSILFILIVLIRKCSRNRIIVFGVSEALLLCLLRPDVVVVSGLGRLLGKKSKWRKLYFRLFRFSYCLRTIVVLNSTDARLFKAMHFNRVIKISGEGYKSKLSHNYTNFTNGLKAFEILRILYVGRLLKSKGVHKLIEDFIKWSEKYPGQLELVIVGDCDFNSNDSIDSYYFSNNFLSNNSNIKFVGYCTDINAHVTSSTIFLSLSEREGMPFSVLEMLDAGIPCILSYVPGHQDLSGIKNIHYVKPNESLSDIPIEIVRNLPRTRPLQINAYSSEAVEQEIMAHMKKGFI